MKKQILTCFGLYFSLLTILSFPMEPDQNQERQLVVFNQSQESLANQRQQNIAVPIISTSDNPQAGSSSPQINVFATHNHQMGSLPDTAALISDEKAKRFIASAPTSNARRIINMIMKRCSSDPTTPHKGSLKFLFLGESGTGKTLLIKAIIATLKRPFVWMPTQEIMEQNQNSVLQYMKNTVGSFLEKDSPCVIAADDIDRFDKPNATYLLSQYMDQAEVKDRDRHNPHFIFLASANHLDDHSKRICSRSTIVEMRSPDYSSRLKILTHCIKDTSIQYKHGSIEDLAKRTESLSIKNLGDLIDFSIILNDTKAIPYYYLNPPLMEQMLKELLPEEEVKREGESLSVKSVGEQSQDGTSIVILSTVGGIIKFVLTKVAQDWLVNLIQRKIIPK